MPLTHAIWPKTPGDCMASTVSRMLNTSSSGAGTKPASNSEHARRAGDRISPSSALSLEDDFEGSTAFNVAGRLTMTGLNPLGAEWRNDLQVGTEPRLESEFYQPLSYDSRFFVAPRVKLEQRNVNTFQSDITTGRYRVSEAEFGLRRRSPTRSMG